jgi:hypothetical protein
MRSVAKPRHPPTDWRAPARCCDVTPNIFLSKMQLLAVAGFIMTGIADR